MAKEIEYHPELDTTTRAALFGLGVAATTIGVNLIKDGIQEGYSSHIATGTILVGQGIEFISLGALGANKFFPMADSVYKQSKNQYHKLEKRFAANPKI